MFSLSLPKEQRLSKITPLDLSVFIYFVTLHADQLSLVIGPYTVRFNNLFSLLLLFALGIRFRASIFRFDKRLALALAAVTLSIVVSLVLSPYHLRCFFFFAMFGLTVLCYVILPYALVLICCPRRLIALYFLSFIVVGLYATCQLILSVFGIKDPFVMQSMWKMYRPNAFSYEPSFYALYMTPFVVWVNGHYLMNHEKPLFLFQRVKIGHILFINALFLASTTTTAFFTYLIFFVLLGLGSFWPTIHRSFPSLRKSLCIFVLVFGCAMTLFSFVFWEFSRLYFLKFFTIGFFAHFSFFERWQGIIDAIIIFLRHPFFGVGLGGIPPYLADAWTQGDSAFSYFRVSFISHVQSILKYFEPSNVFTEILASLGIFGFLAFGVFLWVYCKKAQEAFVAAKEQKGTIFLLCLSTLISLIVLQFNQGLLRPYIWVHLSLSYAFYHFRYSDLNSNFPFH